MSILTYNFRHNKDFSSELKKAKQVAEFAIKNRQCRSSKDVRQFGLPSAVSNQILRKWGRNRKAKSVKSVKLTVPHQSIQMSDGTLRIKCLGISIPFGKDVEKVLQAEVGKEFIYISCQVKDSEPFDAKEWIGIDRNATGSLAVAALPDGRVLKLGKRACHVSKKYRAIRRKLQKKGKLRKLKTIRRRESRILRDINHKISRHLINLAAKNGWGIKLEDLKDIGKSNIRRRKPKTEKAKRKQKEDKAALHSWPFYQLGMFLEYKAKLLGVPLVHVAPQYTSQQCARCGLLGLRCRKAFKCLHCGHVEHADANAAFNIALRPALPGSMSQSSGEWVPKEGNIDIPQWATA